MNFWQNVLSMFVGVLLGFVFSILLFYLTNRWSNKAQKKFLEKNLIKEFEFNEYYLKKILEDLKKAIEKITVDDKKVFCYFNYRNYQRLFLQTYLQRGLLYEKLDPDDVGLLDKISSRINQFDEKYINDSIQKWKEGNLDRKQVLGILTFERDSIEGFIKGIGGIKRKITTNK